MVSTIGARTVNLVPGPRWWNFAGHLTRFRTNCLENNTYLFQHVGHDKSTITNNDIENSRI